MVKQFGQLLKRTARHSLYELNSMQVLRESTSTSWGKKGNKDKQGQVRAPMGKTHRHITRSNKG